MAKLFKGIASILLAIVMVVAYTPTFSLAFDEADGSAIEQEQVVEPVIADEPAEPAAEAEPEVSVEPESEVEPVPAPAAGNASSAKGVETKSAPAADDSDSSDQVQVRGASGEAASLAKLIIFTGVTPNKDNVLLKNASDTSYSNPRTVTFDPATLEYELANVADSGKGSLTQLRFRPEVSVEGSTVILNYTDADGVSQTKDITWNPPTSSTFCNCLHPGTNELEIVVNPPEGSEIGSTTYKVKVDCVPTLKSLSLSQGGSAIYLDKTFDQMTNDYSITVPSSVKTIDVAATPVGSYTVTYNGASSSSVDISDESVKTIDIAVSTSQGSSSCTNTYTVAIERVDSTAVGFDITPSDAMLSVYDSSGAMVKPDASGKFVVMPGETYSYVASKAGYLSATGTIDGSESMISIALVASSSSLPDVDSSWPNLRGSDSNMAIVDYETPVDLSLTDIIWCLKLSETGSAGSFDSMPSVQIIADNALVVMSGKSIYKLDLTSGEVIARGDMVEQPNWGYTPPTYADGMIFAPLANGTVQAFNAQTLESLWVYRDPLKGQSLTPITYSDGCVYTGFWKNYTTDANYVCLTATDEDPSSPDEQKSPSWRFSYKGGFYWAGAAQVGNALIVGTSNGLNDDTSTASPGHIISIDKSTGAIISSLNIVSTARSAVAYDESTGQVYFVTKAGMLYRVDVDSQTGVLSNLKSANMGHASTSTPVIYDGVLYVGCGDGFEQGYVMAYDASTLGKIFEISAPGNVQSSLLLSTAYKDSGYIYVYFTYNNPPGGLGMLKIKNPPTSASDAEYVDIFDAAGYEQYNITSPIAGTDGSIYFKNDTGFIFAIGEISAKTAERAIDAIGEVTLESESAINSARRIFDKLAEAEQAKVSNYDVLLAAEALLAELKKEAEEADDGGGGGNGGNGGNNNGGNGNKPGGSTAPSGASGYTRSLGLTLATQSSLKGVSAKASALSEADQAAIARAKKLGHLGDAPQAEDNSGLLTWAIIGGAALLVLFLLLLLKRNNDDDDEEEESAEGE